MRRKNTDLLKILEYFCVIKSVNISYTFFSCVASELKDQREKDPTFGLVDIDLPARHPISWPPPHGSCPPSPATKLSSSDFLCLPSSCDPVTCLRSCSSFIIIPQKQNNKPPYWRSVFQNSIVFVFFIYLLSANKTLDLFLGFSAHVWIFFAHKKSKNSQTWA